MSEKTNPDQICVDCGAATSTKSTLRCWPCSREYLSGIHAAPFWERIAKIRELSSGGRTITSIAKELGISRNRVYQLLERAKKRESK